MPDQIADNAALVIVDFQKAIDDPKWGRRNNPDAEQRVGDLLALWRHLGRPVVHVQHLSTEPGSPYRPGQPGCDFKDSLAPGPGEIVIQKKTNNAFIETGLQASLHDRGITELIIVGVLLHNSVDATVRMAANLGFRTWIAEDATSSSELRDMTGRLWSPDDVHAVSLAQLNGEYATVVRTSPLIASLQTLVAAQPGA
ncbi:cysteine hydrolase [Pelagibius litoralis]|uniref:Cysteine hydrolase n=1 Tax=Pelagibius litoralis TaxID=374515 RepID=A0A967EWI6_9PROT|nr:cysteine hydrolase family protein [Pelagibius litoralis]NIA67023.1 cysteine hydrolase [Pelagibius litoralis]